MEPGQFFKRYLTLAFLLLSFYTEAAFQNEFSFDSFSQEDGLPNNQAQCIFQDRKGWMWFGTSQGLSRFDGYQFVNFLHSPEDSTGFNGTLVRVIYEDRNGNLLIGTENGGLNAYDREREYFHHPYRNTPFFKGRTVSVNDITEDKAGNLWLATDANLVKIDTLGNVIPVSKATDGGPFSFYGGFIRVLQFDNQGKLWVGANEGLFIYHPETGNIEHLKLPSENGETDEIWELFSNNDGSIWVGTYSNGAFVVEPKSRMVQKLPLKRLAERTETVRTISTNNYEDYWIGTRGGLYVYNKTQGIVGFYRHDDREPASLINNSVLDIFHDKRGETWIGTRGGINLLAKSKQRFHSFGSHPSDNKYLNSSIVYTFWIDEKNRIWIGTEDGGVNIYHPESGRFSYLMAEPENPNSVSRNCIKAFLDDKKGNLWIGTFLGGIDVLNLKTGRFTHYKNNSSDLKSLSDNRVWDFLLDNEGDIWVGTSTGLNRFDAATQSFVRYPQIAGQEQVNWIKMDSYSNIWLGTPDEVIIYNPESKNITRFAEHPRYFLEDSKGRCWIATLDKGLALYSTVDGAIRYYNQRDGLSNNQALCILEDDDHFLWISTSNGLSKFNPETGSFQNYTSRDGLTNNQFTYGAAYKSKDGKLLFGSISGFNIFDPLEVRSDDSQVPLVLTELRVFNKKVEIAPGKKSILKKSISETNHLIFDYSQNVVTLEFAALNYVNSRSNQFSYFLEGFDKEWNGPSVSRSATYTNLDPGDYIFRVKRVVPDSVGPENELQVKITVLPPYWKTRWFRFLVLLVIGALIYMLVQFLIYREKIKNELVVERMKARKLHELDMLKLKFFTNISHEIRTPLTLILAPLEKLISREIPPEEVRSHLEIMHRNSRQLDRLINQLLDFRKLESGNLKLELLQGDLVRFVSDIVHSFDNYAEEKEIQLRFNTLKKRLMARFDADKIEKILNNLLSNAFKFTGKGGKITVNLSLVFDSADEELSGENQDREYVEIMVRDTGQGISQRNLTKIFNRFFQAGEQTVQTGTGIGLAFVKELVELHKGKIFVESRSGKGSKFIVRIPYEAGLEELPGEEPAAETVKKSEPEVSRGEEIANDRACSDILLIVEDNPDVRSLIKSHFSAKFRVLEANDGREGWEIALNAIPDVIISDVLMPDVDGYEFCRRIKKDERTSHIPVLLLTALHSKEHEMKGLSCGADDYITKPFDLNILQTKIDNMLSVRNSLKEKYSGEITLQPKNIVISSPDEKFLSRVVAAVEENISDADLDIERFAQKVGVSRMQLYRKLDALTDMTVKEFIRNIRLKRAAQLLLQEKMTVSEIAYAVGFKDLSHFRKCFRQVYGMSASEYIQKNSLSE
ncbi:MAG: two-component regulator propeller domain-containing protein [Prolixibacteraceae bacterium]|nr:two-component regulator propeller domain-containing protein [Prolixibacteraceae bacterium]